MLKKWVKPNKRSAIIYCNIANTIELLKIMSLHGLKLNVPINKKLSLCC